MTGTSAGRPAAAVRVAVPNRVDLAGGTLDIYPVYLLVPFALTVNAAISLRSVVEILPVRGPARLVSLNFPARCVAADTHGFARDGRLGLIADALRLYPAVRGIEVRVRNEAPFGSGLGGSSALLVAAMLAAGAYLGFRSRWEETAGIAREVEAGHLGTLTGSQDHIAALRGGVQGIRFVPGRVEAERLGPRGPAGRALESLGVLAHTGIAHRSGRVNWRMIRGALDGDRAVLRKFRGIASAAREAWEALRAGDVEAAGRTMEREWAIRKTLAPGVSPRKVEEAFGSREFRARIAGAKLCGAGGGGMAFGILRDPSDRAAVESFLARRGFAIWPFRLSGGPAVERGTDAVRA